MVVRKLLVADRTEARIGLEQGKYKPAKDLPGFNRVVRPKSPPAKHLRRTNNNLRTTMVPTFAVRRAL